MSDSSALSFLPPEAVSSFRMSSAFSLAKWLRTTAILLVKVRPDGGDDDELVRGLRSYPTVQGWGRPVADDNLGFQTALGRAASSSESTAALLAEGVFYIVPLRARDTESANPHRLSVGRARNCDVVLRDASVSKLHGWIENERGSWLVADSGSRNGIRVAGRTVDPRRSLPIAFEQTIHFGDVRTLLFSVEQVLDLVKRAM